MKHESVGSVKRQSVATLPLHSTVTNYSDAANSSVELTTTGQYAAKLDDVAVSLLGFGIKLNI